MKGKTGALLAAILAAACALLIFPAQTATGAKNGIDYSLNILVPSLYPFMVLSVFVVKSGLAEKLGRVLEKPTRALFRLPGDAAAAVLMTAIGGYPSGARSVAALYETGAVTGRQAERMLCFCVNAGPSFVITAVGFGFLKSTKSGAILFASQILAFLAMGILCGALWGEHGKKAVPPKKKTAETETARALIESAADAADSTLTMCCFVILFAALMGLLRSSVKRPVPSAALSSLLEITGGCSDLAKLKAPLWAFALALGWGGVCVHFQVLACAGGFRVKKSRFVLCRAVQGMLAAAICAGLTFAFPSSAETFSNFSGPVSAGLSGSVPSAAALLILCAAFLLSIPRRKLDITERSCYNGGKYRGSPCHVREEKKSPPLWRRS